MSSSSPRVSTFGLEAVIRQMPVAVMVVEAASLTIVAFNDHAREMVEVKLGRSIAERLEDQWELFHSDGRPYLVAEWPVMRSIAAAEEVIDEEYFHVLPDGSRLIVRSSSSPIFDDHGEIVAGVLVMTDLTEQRWAQEERRYQASLLDNVEDGVIATDAKDFRVTAWNRGAERIYGFTAQEALGRPAREIACCAGDESPFRLERELLETGRTRTELTAVRKDGTPVEVELIAVAVKDERGEISGSLGIHRDITEHKPHLDALRSANARIVSILESSTDEFIAFDERWAYTYVNERALKAINNALGTRLTREDLSGKTVWDLFPAFAETEVYAELERSRVEARPVRVEAYSESEDRWVEVRAFPWNGGLSTYTRDITERRAADQQQAFHASLLENVEDGVIATDAVDFRVTAWNRGAERIYGFTAQEALGRPAREVASYLGGESRHKLERELLDTGRTRTELTAVRKDGTPVEVELIAVAVKDERGEISGYLGIHRDITERKRAGHRLNEAREGERRRIARALHDEALQALAKALVLAIAADARSADSGPTGELVAALRHVGEELRGAIYDLRLDDEERRPFPELLQELMAAQREMADNFEIELDLGERIPADSLGNRGVEALRIVGEALTNARRHADARHVRVRAWGTETTLCLEVADDGRGFDPTIRAPALHHGLEGMRERAELLAGHLEIHSQPNHGTTVRLEVSTRDGTGGRV